MSESAKIGLSKSVENKTCYIFSSVAQNELIFGQSQYSNLFHVSWSFNGDSIWWRHFLALHWPMNFAKMEKVFCNNSKFITAMHLKLSKLQHWVIFYLWWKFQINRVIFEEVMGSEVRKMGIFLHFSHFTPKNENSHISLKSDPIELNFSQSHFIHN